MITPTDWVSQLANNETEKSSPKVSKLPLPISDSPLVIDLPDGQKIVVGKMTQGSVIEVATWRGVGRPDSRTSRLMLGMGSGNVNEENESEASSAPSSSGQQGSQAVKRQGFAGFISTALHFIKNLNRVNWSATFKALLASMKSLLSKKKKAGKNQIASGVATPPVTDTNVRPAVTISRASEDADIEAWLNKITEKAVRENAPKSSAKPSSVKAPSAPKAKTPAKKSASKSSSTRPTKKR